MRTARQNARDARQLWRLCQRDGHVDEARARQIVDGVLASGRSAGPAMLSGFLKWLKRDRARHSARVESATPLAADVRAAVEQGLAARYGADLTTTFTVDPSLIAGVRVRVGDDVFDGSVKGGLTALDARF